MEMIQAGELTNLIEEFYAKLDEHKDLWVKSFASGGSNFPIRNHAELEIQTKWLQRRLGALRPYIERFDTSWIMVHPQTGVTWDALNASVGLSDVSLIKSPSIKSVLQKLNTIIGRIETLAQEDFIPEDPNKPLQSGYSSERLMLAYLEHLHPFISKGCSSLFQDGHHTQAVEEGVKAVFQYLRDVTGLTGDGAALAQSAFSPKSPILTFSDLSDETKKNEQVGFMEILAAVVKGVRHPLAHTHGRVEEAQKAFEYLVLASLLCRRIDDAKIKSEIGAP